MLLGRVGPLLLGQDTQLSRNDLLFIRKACILALRAKQNIYMEGNDLSYYGRQYIYIYYI